MSTMKVLNMAGAEVGTVELNDAVFGIEPNQTVVHEVVKNHLANAMLLQVLRREHNNRDMRGSRICLQLFSKLQTVHNRHHHIADHQVRHQFCFHSWM